MIINSIAPSAPASNATAIRYVELPASPNIWPALLRQSLSKTGVEQSPLKTATYSPPPKSENSRPVPLFGNETENHITAS